MGVRFFVWGCHGGCERERRSQVIVTIKNQRTIGPVNAHLIT